MLRPLLAILVLLLIPGCSGVETSNVGDAIVYKNSIASVALLVTAGLVLLTAGLVFLVASYDTRSAATGHPTFKRPSLWQKAAGTIGGVILLLGGLAILGVGVPYRFMAHITVDTDRMTLRDSVLWFINGERVFLYDDIGSVSQENMIALKKRKQRQMMNIKLQNGTKVDVEMGALEHAAYSTIIARSNAYYDFKRTTPTSRSTPNSPPPTRQPEVTSQSPSSNTQPRAESTGLGTQGRAVVRRFITIPMPKDATSVNAATQLGPGDKLLSCWNKKWEWVTVVTAHEDGTVRCSWDSYNGYQYDMSRDDLVRGESPPVANVKTSDGKTTLPSVDYARDTDAKSDNFPSAKIPTKVKRYLITIPIPGYAVPVLPETYLVPGTKLGACYNDKWDLVTVMQINDDGSLRCNWDNWSSFTYDMSREDLIIEKSILNKLKIEEQLVSPVSREWADTSGKFRVMATYIDSQEGFVKLRKDDGTDISVSIDKLSPADRSLIRRLAVRP